MQEEDARLALLQTELNSIQAGIRALDAIIFQIKGWCVTASLAVGGFAASERESGLLLVGGAAVLGFFLVNCQFKTFQRAIINRNRAIEAELTTVGIMEFLRGSGSLEVVGTTPVNLSGTAISETSFRTMMHALWREARLPHTFGLYSFIVACLALEALVLLV